MEYGLLPFLKLKNEGSGIWQSQNWQQPENHSNLMIDLHLLHYAYLSPFFVGFNISENILSLKEFKIKKIKLNGQEVIKYKEQIPQSFLTSENTVYESKQTFTSPNQYFTITYPHSEKILFFFNHGTRIDNFLSEGIYEIHLTLTNRNGQVNHYLKSEPFRVVSDCKKQNLYTTQNTLINKIETVSSTEAKIYFKVANQNTFVQFYLNNTKIGNELRILTTETQTTNLNFDTTNLNNTIYFKCWTPDCIEYKTNEIAAVDTFAVTLSNNTYNNENCPNTPIIFTASAVGAINFEFFVNGISKQNGASNTYSYTIPVNQTTISVYAIAANEDFVFAVSNTQTVKKMAMPMVILSPFPNICLNEPEITLTGGYVVGGVYSGTGVSNGKFYPSIAGVGIHTITYTYTNLFGCSKSATATIEVIICD